MFLQPLAVLFKHSHPNNFTTVMRLRLHGLVMFLAILLKPNAKKSSDWSTVNQQNLANFNFVLALNYRIGIFKEMILKINHKNQKDAGVECIRVINLRVCFKFKNL